MNLHDINIGEFAGTCTTGFFALLLIFVTLGIIEKIIEASRYTVWEDVWHWIVATVWITVLVAAALALILGILWETGTFVRWVFG